MAIRERLSDELFIGALQSLGKSLPQTLAKSIEVSGVKVEPQLITAFRLDTDGEYPQIGPFATGHVTNYKGKRTLFVTPDNLAVHAEELQQILAIKPEDDWQRERLETYCLMQSMVDLTLQAIPNLREEDKEKVRTVFTERNF